MDFDFITSKQYVYEIRAGLPSCVITLSGKDLVPVWCGASTDFSDYHDVDTIGLPFVFEAHLIEETTRAIEPYGVYVACMAYFRWYNPDARSIRFGAISAVGRVDKFTPEQIIKIAREGQSHAEKILAEVKKIW